MKRTGTDPASQARRQDLTDHAREDHDTLTAAIERLEKALAAPATQRAAPWSQQVAALLAPVRKAIQAHADGVERPSGLFDEVVIAMSGLARRVRQLRREHEALIEGAARLAERVPAEADLDFASLRRDAAMLLSQLRAHRAAEADLVFEAFWTDLGAGD